MTAEDYKEAEEVHAGIIRLDLDRSPAFDDLSVGAFATIWNGYGPDDWPPSLRKAMTWLYRNFKELSGVHDVDYHYSDGTRGGWEAATERWRINCGRMLDDRYPMRKAWLWPARAVAWSKLRASYRALQLGSWDAWRDAFYRNIDKA